MRDSINSVQYETLNSNTSPQPLQRILDALTAEQQKNLFVRHVLYQKETEIFPGYKEKHDIISKENTILANIASNSPLSHCTQFFIENRDNRQSFLTTDIEPTEINAILTHLIRRTLSMKAMSEEIIQQESRKLKIKKEEIASEKPLIEEQEIILKSNQIILANFLLLGLEYFSKNRGKEQDLKWKEYFLEKVSCLLDVFYLHLLDDFPVELEKQFSLYEEWFFNGLLQLNEPANEDEFLSVSFAADEKTNDEEIEFCEEYFVSPLIEQVNNTTRILYDWWLGNVSDFVLKNTLQGKEAFLLALRQRRFVMHKFEEGIFGFEKLVLQDRRRVFVKQCVKEALAAVVALDNKNSSIAWSDLKYCLIVLSGYLNNDDIEYEVLENEAPQSNPKSSLYYLLESIYPEQAAQEITITTSAVAKTLLSVLKLIYGGEYESETLSREVFNYSKKSLMNFARNNYASAESIGFLKLFFSDVTEEALDKALREIEKDFESTKSGICLPRLKQIAENNVGIKKKMAIELTEMLYDLCQSEGGNFKLIKTYLGMHTGYLCISEVNALQEKSLSESSVTISVKPNRCRPLPVSTLTCYVQQIKSASPLQEMYLYFVKKLAEEKRGYIFDDLFEKLKEFQNILQALEIKNYPEARRLAESKRFATAQVATRALASWFSSSVEAQRKDPEKRSESHSYHDKKYALRSMTKQMFEKEYEEFKKFLKCREGRQNNAAEMKVYSIVKEVVVLELKRMKLRPVMQDKKDFVA